MDLETKLAYSYAQSTKRANHTKITKQKLNLVKGDMTLSKLVEAYICKGTTNTIIASLYSKNFQNI